MEYTALGKTGERMPVLGMGTWKLGLDRQKEIEALRAGISAGMRFIDTAEMYGNEELVGEAIEGEGEIFIATKVSPHNFNYESMIRACDASLKRLGVKLIDLYQLHWPNRSIDIKETMRAMEKLVDDGKIRHIGISNFSIRETEEAQAALKRNEIVSNQVEYSMLVRDPEKGLLDFCKKNSVTVIAYSPLGMGKFYTKRYDALRGLLDEIGARHGKTASQMALNWIIAKGNIIAIPKAGSREHALENAGASGWRLEDSETDRINHFLSRGYKKRPAAWLLSGSPREPQTSGQEG